MSRREDFHVYSSTTHHEHRNHTAVSGAEYCMFVDMANTMIHMAHRNWQWGKRVIYPLVRDAPDCKKDVSNGYQYKTSTHWDHDEMQCETEVTNTLRAQLVKLKIPPDIIQNPAPKIPNGVQNPFWRPLGKPS